MCVVGHIHRHTRKHAFLYNIHICAGMHTCTNFSSWHFLVIKILFIFGPSGGGGSVWFSLSVVLKTYGQCKKHDTLVLM